MANRQGPEGLIRRGQPAQQGGFFCWRAALSAATIDDLLLRLLCSYHGLADHNPTSQNGARSCADGPVMARGRRPPSAFSLLHGLVPCIPSGIVSSRCWTTGDVITAPQAPTAPRSACQPGIRLHAVMALLGVSEYKPPAIHISIFTSPHLLQPSRSPVS
jgi:hypothetical protein